MYRTNEYGERDEERRDDQLEPWSEGRAAAGATAEAGAEEPEAVPEDRDAAAGAGAHEHEAVPEDRDAASRTGADEQGTVPEDRDAAARADGRATADVAAPDVADHLEPNGGPDVQAYRDRWDALQAGFVDDPRAAARQADALVSELLEGLSRRYRQLHDQLEGGADDVGDTEAMRQAVRQYRALFNSLVHE